MDEHEVHFKSRSSPLALTPVGVKGNTIAPSGDISGCA